MKKLQKDFTTPEQSRRLLELGVPADSADCYYSASRDGYVCEGTLSIVGINMFIQSLPFPCVPSWSVGRLIDIFNECSKWNSFSITSASHETHIEQLMKLYEKHIDDINFSKLE